MLVVVGGHSRNIGKTSVVAGLIQALPEARWTAIKITQHGHGICSAAGAPCDCAIEYDHPYAISEQFTADDSDTGRFVSGGAARTFWLRTAVGQLGHAVEVLRRILESSENAIVESNSVLDFFDPDLYLVVLDLSVRDVKESSRRFLSRADAFIVNDRKRAAPVWEEIFAGPLAEKPRFTIAPPYYVSPELAGFVRDRLRPSA